MILIFNILLFMVHRIVGGWRRDFYNILKKPINNIITVTYISTCHICSAGFKPSHTLNLSALFTMNELMDDFTYFSNYVYLSPCLFYFQSNKLTEMFVSMLF